MNNTVSETYTVADMVGFDVALTQQYMAKTPAAARVFAS